MPGSLPVINLARHQRDCVRFDRHVVYLGAPGPDESCPSRLVGTTEALVIQPAAARAGQSSVENPVSRRISVVAPRIRVTATFDTDPTQIYQILASAFLPAPIIEPPTPAAQSRRESAGPRRRAGRTRVIPVQVTNYHGLGFDTCTAPSTAYMQAWLRQSRYRPIGIYIGGSDEACAQANLTTGWLRGEAAAGWHFLPMYVGPQADFGELSAHPGHQGREAADDAVVQAERLGLGPGAPIYYDMEAYLPDETGAVLRFESAIPDVIYDALWNGQQNTSDSVFQPGEWANHQRVHQFAGNVLQTFGGDTINVDRDFMDVDLAGPGGTSQTSPAVLQDDGVVDVFYRGADNKLWYVRHAPGSGWASPAALATSVMSARARCTAVLAGSTCSTRGRAATCGRWPAGRAGDGRPRSGSPAWE